MKKTEQKPDRDASSQHPGVSLNELLQKLDDFTKKRGEDYFIVLYHDGSGNLCKGIDINLANYEYDFDDPAELLSILKDEEAEEQKCNDRN